MYTITVSARYAIMGPQDTPDPSKYSTDEQSQKLSIEILTGQHRDVFTRAVENVLSTEIAQITYAQIADGLPLSSVEKDTYAFGALTYDHPLHTNHIDLCPDALEKTRQLYAEFDPDILCIDHKVRKYFAVLSPIANINLRYYSLSMLIKLRLQTREHSRHG